MRFQISEPFAEQVKPSAVVPRRDGRFAGETVDISHGGLGLMLPMFLPRGVVIDLNLMGSTEPDAKVLLNCPVLVHRVVMTDRRPAYMLGVSFASENPEVKSAVKAFILEVEGELAPSTPRLGSHWSMGA